MVTETFNIITNVDSAVVPYSNLLANILTVLWGCVFYGFYRIMNSLFQEHQPGARACQLITFSLLIAMFTWGMASALFLPFTGDTLRFFPASLEIPLPLPGILITFVILAILAFLSFRKKQCSFWLKLGLVVLTIILTLLAAHLAVGNSFILTLGREMLRRQVHLFMFLSLGHSISSAILCSAAIEQNNRELQEQSKALEEEPA